MKTRARTLCSMLVFMGVMVLLTPAVRSGLPVVPNNVPMAVGLFSILHTPSPLSGQTGEKRHTSLSARSVFLESLAEALHVRLRTFLLLNGTRLTNKERGAVERLLQVSLPLQDQGVLHPFSSIQGCLAWMGQFSGFDDLPHLYQMFTCSPSGHFSRWSFLEGFPFDDLRLYLASHAVGKDVLEALDASEREESLEPLMRLALDGESVAVRRAAYACYAAMLVHVCQKVLTTLSAADSRISLASIMAVFSSSGPVASCVSIVEIYEQVERLPIEETLQALHRLIYSVGTMLMQLGEKEQGFVGWLQHKWKYLPIAIVIVIMRIAKYYWGSQHSNMSTLYGSSDIGSPFPAWAAEQGGVGDAGLHDMSGDMRIAVQRENAGVIVGLT